MRILALLSLLAISIGLIAKNEFTITGTLNGDQYNGQTIYLKSFENMSTFENLDSTIIKGNTFEIKGTLNSLPQMGMLYIASATLSIPLVIEAGNIGLIHNADNIQVTGTPMNLTLQAFLDEQNQITQKARTTEQSDPAFVEIIETAKKSALNFISKNRNNNVGEFMLVSAMSLFNKDELASLVEGMRPEFLKSEYGSQIKQYAQSKEAAVGEYYKDIRLWDETGKKIAISDYVGKNKVILLDFWASWCGPCRKEMPIISEAYNKYKEKGFEIIGISLDGEQQAWSRAIKSMNMTWPQMSDLGGWKSEAAVLYNVTSIPFTLLLDKDGKIIAMNLRGERLLNKLEELLK